MPQQLKDDHLRLKLSISFSFYIGSVIFNNVPLFGDELITNSPFNRSVLESMFFNPIPLFDL